MSARAWEQRRKNKRERIQKKKIARIFGLPYRLMGPGSYQLALEQQKMMQDFINEMFEEFIYEKYRELLLTGETYL